MRVGLMACMAVTLAAGAEAQRPSERVRERGTISVVPEQALFKVFTDRGRMGITVSMEFEPSDSIGALVDAVTPAGPAYVAGIRANDVITAVNGRALVQNAREMGKVTPGLALVEMAAQMEAGDTARLDYRRGNQRRRATVVLEKAPEMFDGTTMQRSPMPGSEWPNFYFRHEPVPLGMEEAGPGIVMYRTRVMNLELAPMNPELGQYFGITEGVLVINVPQGSQLGLRPGDVVLSVDGRKMSNPNQMFRALLSYEAGEPIKFDVTRLKRREVVTGKIAPNP